MKTVGLLPNWIDGPFVLPGGLTEEDFRILEFIASRDMVTDPKTVALNLTDIKPQKIRNRLTVLKDHGLLKRPEMIPEGLDAEGTYEATDLGKTLVRDDLTVAELRELAREQDDSK